MKLSFTFKKKKAGAKVPASASGRRAAGGKGLDVMRQTVIAGLVSALVVIAACLFLAYSLSSQVSEARQARLPAVAHAYAERVNAMTGRYRLLAMRLANGVSERVAEGEDGWPALESRLRGYFPDALRLRLLPPGISETDDSMTPPLGYACLDMLTTAARTGQAPRMELHGLKSEQRHLDIVVPVKADGRVKALLLVSLPVGLAQGALNGLSLQGVYVELKQRLARGKLPVLASIGDASLKVSGESFDVELGDANWLVSAWIDGSAGLGGHLMPLALTVGAALAMIAAALFALFAPVARGLRQDMTMVQRFFKDAMAGTLARQYPARVVMVRDTLGVLLGQARARRDEAREQAAERESDGADDALAKMLNLDDPGPDLSERQTAPVKPEPQVASRGSVFRAYDIRGVVGETLDDGLAEDIGRAIGSEAHARGEQAVIVARDGRLSSPALTESLIRGLRASGRDVIDIGRVPTPLLYFSTHFLGSASGVMVTGSHNPPEYNGFKVVLRGETLAEEGIQDLRRRVEEEDFLSGAGDYNEVDIVRDYLARVTGDVKLARPLKVVIDCGNGVASEVAPELFRALGCEVSGMFCEVDGHFPNHHPDPSVPENLLPLVRAVREQGADLGLAFDGDGDRIGVITSAGEIVWPDRLLMLFAQDVLSRNPGSGIIYDIKSSRNLEQVIEQHGGKPMLWKTGHSLIKARMRETGALLGGEMSGHIFFQERWFGFDDAMYVAARLLEILAADGRSSQEVFAGLPDSVNTPELRIGLEEGEPFLFMQRFLAKADFGDARLNDLDGLRVEFDEGWGLIRASNTAPCLVLRFEADDVLAMKHIQERFREQLRKVDAGLELPF